MKFLRLLSKNLSRNLLRTILTVCSIAASLFLVTTLLTVLNQLTSPPDTPESALRLITRHKISLFNVLPYAYREKIAAVEGVEAVIGSMWFGGVYGDKGTDVQLAQFAVDADQFFQVNADMVVADEQKSAFIEDRAGACVGQSLADRFGWKLGDTIHTRSNLFSVDVELKVRAIYEGGADQASGLYFQWKYFNEAIQGRFGDGGGDFTGTYSIKVDAADDVAAVADRVDEQFKNSTTPTKTETEKAFILGFISMLGNIQLLIGGICSAVIFAVVLIAANTMAMSFRERAREVGILKALGFRKSQVLGLMLGESLMISLAGTVVGALGAKLIFSGVNLASVTGGFLQDFRIPTATLIWCSLIGLLIGLLSAGIPAWKTAQRPVVDALRKIA